jgi:hypothetical protein
VLTKPFATSLLTLSIAILASASAGPARAPFGWLQIPEKAVVLRIHQTGINAACRQGASDLAGGFILEVVRSGVKTYLSPEFLKEEAAYYRSDTAARGTERQANVALANALEGFVANQAMHWSAVDALAAKYSDGTPDSSRWPWSFGPRIEFDRALLLLKNTTTPALPFLDVEMRWTSKSGYSAGVPLGGDGLTVCNVGGIVRLRGSDGAVRFEKAYGPGAEKSSYNGWEDTPAAKVAEQVGEDVRRGVQKPAPRLNPTRPGTPSIAGSRWTAVSDGPIRSKEIWLFGPNGAYSSLSEGTEEKGDGWTQDGEIVRFSYNNHLGEVQCVLTDPARMACTLQSSGGLQHWAATRAPK